MTRSGEFGATRSGWARLSDPERWRAGGDLRRVGEAGALVGLWVGGLVLLLVTLHYYGWRLGRDADAYWGTGHPTHPLYSVVLGEDRYLYSPAFAQAIAPVSHLPWPAFVTIWTAAETLAFAWLLRPLGWRWAAPLLLWCSPELVIGNILGFVAVAVVMGLRRSWTWPACLLTKPTFGVGLLWFVVRGEWRRLAVALVATAAVVGLSFAYDPDLWFAWLKFLHLMSTGAGDAGATLPVRLVIAVVLTVVAARRGWAWLVPVALLVATPVFVGAPSLTILAACVRLAGEREPSDGAADTLAHRGPLGIPHRL
jgi:hypothetical protein